jgi:hypothetical protein
MLIALAPRIARPHHSPRFQKPWLAVDAVFNLVAHISGWFSANRRKSVLLRARPEKG